MSLHHGWYFSHWMLMNLQNGVTSIGWFYFSDSPWHVVSAVTFWQLQWLPLFLHVNIIFANHALMMAECDWNLLVPFVRTTVNLLKILNWEFYFIRILYYVNICCTNINSSSSVASTVLTSSHGVGALLTGPTNFYQLIEEGANLKDRYSFFSSANATTANINNKESVKENSGTNGSIQSVTSSIGSNSNRKSDGSSTTPSIHTKATLDKNNNFLSITNASSSLIKSTYATGIY